MTEKQTTILGFITLFAVLGAVWLLFGDKSGSGDLPHDTVLYPGLSSELGTVASLEIKGPLNSTHIKQDGSVWRVTEKDGYPADIAKIRTLLKALADSRILLVKTDNPALYDRLGLGEDAVHVTVRDKDEKPLAALDIGDRTYENGDFPTYVRRAGEARSYQVSALPEVLASPVQWLDQRLLHLDTSRVASITISLGDNPDVTISRKAPTYSFSLAGDDANLPEGDVALMDMLVDAYTDLSLDDVKASGSDMQTVGPDNQAHTILRTFDGLALAFSFRDSLDETGDVWVDIEANYEQPDPDTLPKTLPDVPEDGAQEAETLSDRLDGWSFRLDRATATALLKERSELEIRAAVQD